MNSFGGGGGAGGFRSFAERARALLADPQSQPGGAIPTMPVASPDDPAMQAAKKRSLADMIARRGRASTILTSDNTEKLGS